MDKYVIFYGDKKLEDNICIINMFENTKQINLGWTDFDLVNNVKIAEEYIKKGTNQIIFLGLEIGWDKLIKKIKEKNPNIKIKVICNTQDSLLYYDYERENFFTLLELSKEKIIDDIAFLRKGQYEIYRLLGYECSYLVENYILKKENKEEVKKENKIIDIGMYPLNYTWDKNIFNQLCIAKYIENSNLNYNQLEERMKDFVNTMEIENKEDKINKIEEKEIIQKVIKNNINIACAFTDYLHPVFFISMEQGIPCIIGNTTEIFEDEIGKELKQYIITEAEDNSIENSKIVEKCLKNKEKVMDLYTKWKIQHNEKSKQSIENFINK